MVNNKVVGINGNCRKFSQPSPDVLLLKNIKLNDINLGPRLGLAHKSGGINCLNRHLDI